MSGKKVHQRIQRRFAPLILVFAVIVLVISGLIFYTAFGRTTIVVTTVPQRTTQEFIIQPDEIDAPEVRTEIDHTYRYTNFPDIEPTPAQATGTVTIVNNYSASQPLVETTRLLSNSGVLFRTAETVTVPSGGQVDVPVYADQAGEPGNIGPSRFEIVALWEGLKDNIYGVSDEAMTGGLVYNVTVDEKNQAAAQVEAEQHLRQSVIAELEQKANVAPGTIQPESLWLDLTEEAIVPEIGTQTDEIVVRSKGTATALAVDKNKIVDILETEMGQDVKPAEISYVIQPTDETIDGPAQLVIIATAPIQQSNLDSSFIKKDQLTNRTAEEIISILRTYEQVSDVEVHFNPFWLQRSPVMADDIDIQVAQ